MYATNSSGLSNSGQFAVDVEQLLNSSEASSKKSICEASSNQTMSRPAPTKKVISPAMAPKKGGKQRSENTAKDIPDAVASGYATPDEPETVN